MKALLVGAGGMGQAWARNLSANQDCDLIGWVDVRPGAASDAAKQLEIPDVAAETDLNRAIEKLAPDFVVDVTSPNAHCSVTLTALSHGLPVLGEKPMASNLDEARQMVAASERAGKLYMISQSRRYDPGLVALRKGIQSHVPQLGILNVDFYIGAHFGGFRDEMESPLLLDMAIHTFDQARFLSGADPVSVIAEEFNPGWSWYQGDACASASFEMSDGSRFNYRGSWCAEGFPTSWDGDWRAVGCGASATWLRNGDVVVEQAGGDGFIKAVETQTIPQPQIKGGIEGSLSEFLECLNSGKTPQGECHDNIKSFAMVFAAKESAKNNCRVTVEW